MIIDIILESYLKLLVENYTFTSKKSMRFPKMTDDLFITFLLINY